MRYEEHLGNTLYVAEQEKDSVKLTRINADGDVILFVPLKLILKVAGAELLRRAEHLLDEFWKEILP